MEKGGEGVNAPTGRAGIIRAAQDGDSMDKLAHAVLDDVLYNLVSDILMKVHRDEKTARAATAAIRVEKLALDTADSSTPEIRPDVRVETEAAIYEDGKVLLKGNPLKTTKEILCPKCHLPRLLHPTDGRGAKRPDPTIIYCKKHPYIDKPNCDIYGQSWVGPGPGRGKKKKDIEKSSENPDQKPPNVLSFPSATCSKCKRCILVTRLNNHMGSCIGNSGRNASRAAVQKMSNGNGNGSQNDPTPPNSQKATPGPGSRAGSPRKRDASDDDDDDDESETSHRKKKLKTLVGGTPTMTKKVIIRAKPTSKKDKIKGGSSLSQEHKAQFDNISDSVEVIPKKLLSAKNASPAKKLKNGKTHAGSPIIKNGSLQDPGGESESSGPLSSPPR